MTLMPEKWVTLYKTLHPTTEKNQPIQTTTCTFRTLPDGTVETLYERETHLQDTPSCFPSSFSISTPLHIFSPPQREYDDVPINYFDSQPSGKYDYLVSYGAPPATPYPIHPTGWNDDPDLNMYYKKAFKHISPSKRTTTFVATLCAMYTSNPRPPPTTMPPSLTSLEAFPPLTPFTIDHTSHSWKIKDPITVDLAGNTKKPSLAKTVLNW
ncbi:hypothetical protein Patl1_20401 [Pistacia atlantica]|uniref:Uncharacterized protein n=1 Tax=Pistacia atlantica TaxID=434234 RepID=A0ACC1BM79_9ROSI|nr:hypothetical protein Patl1_20401 [Pistacia atlantica]